MLIFPLLWQSRKMNAVERKANDDIKKMNTVPNAKLREMNDTIEKRRAMRGC